MKCPNPDCNSTIRPEWKLCIYCGYDLRGAGDSRTERAGMREREADRADRYAADDDDRSRRDDDEYVGRGGNEEPPPREGRSSSRRRGRSPEWDEPPADTDDSLVAPAYPPRNDRGNARVVGPGRSGSGYGEDDDDHEEDGAYGDRWSRAPRPSPRRSEDRDPRDDRQESGSRPRSDRFDDPLDDPRAPGFLRGSAAPRDVGRPGSPSRNGRAPGYDDLGGGRRPPSSRTPRRSRSRPRASATGTCPQSSARRSCPTRLRSRRQPD